MKRANHGFTLIELSIVLVIVGLLAGGVVTGQYLIKQAELNSILTDLGKFKAAYVQFQSTYGGKPGDLKDAETYFGTDVNGCSSTVRTPRMTTCNGNGDNLISVSESWRAWQQMAAAELVEGAYSGVGGSGGASHAAPGENQPAGRLRNSGYYLVSFNPGSSAANYFAPAVISEALFFGGETSASWTSTPLLTPRQQEQLDRKFDDGKPGTGSMYSLKSPLNPNCTLNDLQTTDYRLIYPGAACTLVYLLEY